MPDPAFTTNPRFEAVAQRVVQLAAALGLQASFGYTFHTGEHGEAIFHFTREIEVKGIKQTFRHTEIVTAYQFFQYGDDLDKLPLQWLNNCFGDMIMATYTRLLQTKVE